MPTVTYHLEPDLTPEDFIDMLMRSLSEAVLKKGRESCNARRGRPVL